jgi:hypothetical protein
MSAFEQKSTLIDIIGLNVRIDDYNSPAVLALFIFPKRGGGIQKLFHSRRARGSNHLVCAVCATATTMLIIRFEMGIMYAHIISAIRRNN